MRYVIAAQVANYRTRKNWSQERLAAELTDIGHPTSRVTIVKTEAGDRRVSVDELYAYGLALDVPVVLLMVPLGIVKAMRVTGNLTLDAEMVRGQIVGDVHYVTDAERRAGRHLDTWVANRLPIHMFKRYGELADRVSSTGTEVELADDLGDVQVASARVRYHEALRALFEHVELMTDAGFQGLPEMHPDWVAAWTDLQDDERRSRREEHK